MRIMRAMPKTFCIFLCALAAAGGCSKPAQPPKGAGPRIVSFSPGITRTLWDMGLGEHVVGVTRFCTLPPGVERPRLGDMLTVNAEAILAVRPTVLFAQTSPSRFQGVRDIDPAVGVVELTMEELKDVPAAIERIGQVVARPKLAARARADFEAKVAAVRRSVAGRPRPRVLFVMGTDRPTAAGPGTFVADMIEAAGGINAGADVSGSTRWRATQIEAVLKAAPDVLICQADPAAAPAAGAYWRGWRDLPAAKAGRVHVVTDPRWTIPSPYLAELLGRLAEMIHGPAATQPSKGRGGDG